jgi:hypothetical protein
MSARGWCYVLENNGDITKGQFGRAEDLINECRKTGLLPIDFTAEDDARAADYVEAPDTRTPEEYAIGLAQSLLRAGEDYEPVSFWDNQPVYIQMVVEKIDLKSLFGPICAEYHVPLINSRGWSDLNLRAGLMRRFAEHEKRGCKPVLLCCGDHDPSGLQIVDHLPRLLAELERAVGWSPSNLTIARFGLNADFINRHNLTWIDGLWTSSGKNLADPKHPHHRHAYVQDYIRQYGPRKVEANALVVRPEAGRRLCRESIEKHLDLNAVAACKRRVAKQRLEVQRALPSALEKTLAVINHYGAK